MGTGGGGGWKEPSVVLFTASLGEGKIGSGINPSGVGLHSVLENICGTMSWKRQTGPKCLSPSERQLEGPIGAERLEGVTLY